MIGAAVTRLPCGSSSCPLQILAQAAADHRDDIVDGHAGYRLPDPLDLVEIQDDGVHDPEGTDAVVETVPNARTLAGVLASRLALIIFGTSLPTVSTSLTGRRMVFR